MAEAGRSRTALAASLTEWMLHRGHADPQIELTRPQPGLSSDTLLAEIRLADLPDAPTSYVLRLPPAGEPLFPDYSLEQQAAVQRAVADAGLPAVRPVFVESDQQWLGAPFVLMPRVAGRTLTTNPPYPREGWLADASPQDQLHVLENFLALLASIHRCNIEVPLPGGSLPALLDYWVHYLDLVAVEPEAARPYADALQWLADHVPADPPAAGLLWGDPQLPNCVFTDDGEIAAALDWEMAARGPAEVDLSWFLTLHEQSGETAGTTLPGDPGRERLIARYEQHLGRPVHDLRWYDVFANVRSGLIVLRIGELLAARGVDRGWTRQVPQPRHLARLLAA